MLGKRTKENVWFFKQLEEEKTILVKEYEVNKNFSKYEGENYVIFLKGIFDPRSEKNLDWIFITNSEKVALDELTNKKEVSAFESGVEQSSKKIEIMFFVVYQIWNS